MLSKTELFRFCHGCMHHMLHLQAQTYGIHKEQQLQQFPFLNDETFLIKS